MSDTVIVPKSTFVMLCGASVFVTLLLLILLLLPSKTRSATNTSEDYNSVKGTLIQDKVPVPIEPKLAEFLKNGQFHSIFLADTDGRIKWASATDGAEIRSCGNAIDGIEKCGLNNISITKITQITLMDIEKNPKCKLGDVDGALGVVHKTNDPDGRWKAGQWDCHTASKSQHN